MIFYTIKKKLPAVLFLLLLIGSINSFGQSVVVNKYRNTGGTNDIIELLVIQDNADLRNLVVKDFSGSNAGDAGGSITFNNISFWNGIHAGTLIVIKATVATAADITTSCTDFNLDIGGSNTTYFTVAGSFDLGNNDMCMIKSGSTSGTAGNIHTLRAGNAGTQWTAIAAGATIGTTTNTNGASTAADIAYVNNASSVIGDFNLGTSGVTIGGSASISFGSGNNSTNTNFINFLRGPVSSAASAITSSSFSANWGSLTGASSYILDVSTSSTFASFVTGYNGLNVGNVTTYSVNTNLSPGTTYYYRVRAVNATPTTSGNSCTQTLTTTATKTYTWTGATGGNWTTSTNWDLSDGTTPSTALDNVIVNSNVTIASVPTATIGSLTINAGKTVVFQNSGASTTLTISNVTGTDLTVASTASLTLDYSSSNSVSMILAASATADISGTLKVNGTGSNAGASYTSTGTTTIGTTGIYQHARDGGIIPTATWSSGSTCYITGVIDNIPTGLSQTFHHFTWECSAQSLGTTTSLGGSLATINGNLKFLNTNSNILRLKTACSSYALTVNGNFEISGTSSVLWNSSTACGSVPQSLTLKGNFLLGTGATFDESLQSTGSELNIIFGGTSNQTFTSSGTLNNGSMFYNVSSGAQVTLASDIPVASGMSCTVTGKLTCGTGASPYNVTGAGSFTLASGGTIEVTHTAGITTGIIANGNILTTGGRSYSTAANYTYIGNAVQVTGNGLPASCNNLTINNSSGVTLKVLNTVDGSLNLVSGQFITSSINFVNINNTATTAVTGTFSSGTCVKGPMTWKLINGTATYLFPLSDGGNNYRPFEIINPITASNPVMKVTLSETGASTFDGTLTGIDGRNWLLETVSGTFTSSTVRITENSISTTTGAMGYSSSVQSGDYTYVGNNSIGTTITSNAGMVPGYYALGDRSSITTTATSFGPFCNSTGNTITLPFTTTGSFTPHFDIQISNNTGTFPTNATSQLLTYVSSTAGDVTATIPAAYTAGSGYRVRVVNNNSPTYFNSGDNGSNITINGAVTPAVSIAASPAGAVCAGINVTFTPTPTNGGTPTYHWWKNGIGTGTDLGVSATYSSSALTNGDVIACVMTSTVSCVTSATANSNNITMSITSPVTPSVTIAASPSGGVCTGTTITFTPTPTNGGTPTYHWWKNGSTDLGVSATYSSGSLTNGDVITCIMTSTANCASPTTATSNGITVAINTPAIPTATAGTFIGSTSFTANWNTVSGATSYYVDVYTIGTTYDNLVSWNFPNSPDNATADGGIAANTSQTLTNNATGGPITYTPVQSSSTSAASISGWDNGSGSKYWEVNFSTTGYSNTRFSSAQRSSGTGPKNFKVQYKIGAGGTYTDVPATVTIGDNWTTGVLSNITLPSACDNQSSVYLRWIMTSNTNVNNTTVASGGTSGIDNILVEGKYMQTFVSGYQNANITGNSLDVTDLNSSTTYYYVVRADNGGCTSGNSNEISVITDLPCTPSASITSFNPTSGPVGTRVTITGTGFTGATVVKFGTVNATTFSVVDNTTIIAQVPSGAPTDYIKVKGSDACTVTSSAKYTLLADNGSCNTSSAGSDVYISEVYDYNGGTLSYVEFFNPTGSTITLTSYVLRIVTTGNKGGTNTIDYSLSGSISSGAVKIFSLGTSASSCSVTKAWDIPTASGMNGNDQVFLVKSGTIIDKVNNPNYGAGSQPGFSQVRKATAIGPNTTYTSSDWVISTETCSDLGFPPFVVGGRTVTITTHPADVGCANTISLSVAATSSTGSTSYIWYYNDPSTMNGWTTVSSLPSAYSVSGSGTSSITISGSTAELTGYQFYSKVGSTGSPECVESSNAAQYNPTSKLMYRSVANGLWTNESTWEMSDVSGGPWIAACTYPIAKNCDEVTIQNYVTLPVNLNIDKVTVNTDDTLEISTTALMTVMNGHTGADLIVNGTLYDRGSSVNGVSYEDNTGTSNDATWTLGAAGSVIKTNTSSASKYRDFYETGISNISASGKFIYRYNADGNPTVVSSGMYYPDLYFENKTGSAFSFNNSLMILSGGTASTSLCTVKGNLNIGTTGLSAVTVYNNNISTSFMLINGNINIGTGSLFSNASYDGGSSASYGNGTGLEVKGDITNNGTLTNNAGTGILKLSGSGTQTISGSGTFNLYNVELAKPSQTLVDQQVNLTTSNNLNFSGGILKTNSNKFSVTNPSVAGAVTGYETPNSTGIYGDDKYVYGTLERGINSAATYEYPIGDAVSGEAYNPLQIDIKSSTNFLGSDKAAAKFIPGDPGICMVGPIYFTCSGAQKFYKYSDMTGEGKWNMASSTSTTFDYDIYLHPNLKNLNLYPNEDVLVSGLVYKNVYRALKAPTGTVDWSAYAGGGDPCLTSGYYNIIGVGYSGFSDFAPGGGDGYTSALPVELVSFIGNCIDERSVMLTWKTASEQNSSKFILQRSVHGTQFSDVAIIAAAGYSNTPKTYTVTDSVMVSPDSYYRLIEVDWNGKQTIYPLIQVRCNETETLHIYSSPQNIIVELNSSIDKQVAVNVFEISGKQLYHENKQVQTGFNKLNLELKKQLADGIYIIQVVDGSSIHTTKIAVH